MNFNAFSKSTKKYIILLIVSVVVLLIAENATFRYITILKESANRVAGNLEVQKAINNLYSNYSRMQADVRHALFLKSRILGKNPCNVELIFKSIKQFGGPARQAGGVCAVELALWDICGKAYDIPAWQLLGRRYRDSVRLYADTPQADNLEEQKRLIDFRMNTQGYTWLKMDVAISSLPGNSGALGNDEFWRDKEGRLAQWGDMRNYMSYANTAHLRKSKSRKKDATCLPNGCRKYVIDMVGFKPTSEGDEPRSHDRTYS